jgi:hypothetical protein
MRNLRVPIAVARLAVLACVAASAVFAWRFGWTRGAAEVDRWIYSGGAVALDLLKSTAPLLAVQAGHARKVPQAIAAWFAFVWLTAFSLMCASGLTATQLAEKFANQSVASTAQTSQQATLDRLVSTRKAMPVVPPTSEEALAAANDAVTTAVNQRAVECGANNEKRGPFCKQREADERTARERAAATASNRAVAEKIDELDAKIATAEEALSNVDVKAAAMLVDPQAASMAKAIGADQEPVALVLQVILAVSIEIGSGLGVWLAFGHSRMAEPRTIDAPPTTRPIWATVPPPSIEGPSDGVRRFIQEMVRTAKGSRIAASELYARYEAWSDAQGMEPVTVTMFGRLVSLPKTRKGGRIWYEDAEFSRLKIVA